MAKITVIGSINMDLVVKSDEIPKPGETLFGNELLQIPGAKALPPLPYKRWEPKAPSPLEQK